MYSCRRFHIKVKHPVLDLKGLETLKDPGTAKVKSYEKKDIAIQENCRYVFRVEFL